MLEDFEKSIGLIKDNLNNLFEDQLSLYFGKKVKKIVKDIIHFLKE